MLVRDAKNVRGGVIQKVQFPSSSPLYATHAIRDCKRHLLGLCAGRFRTKEISACAELPY